MGRNRAAAVQQQEWRNSSKNGATAAVATVVQRQQWRNSSKNGAAAYQKKCKEHSSIHFGGSPLVLVIDCDAVDAFTEHDDHNEAQSLGVVL